MTDAEKEDLRKKALIINEVFDKEAIEKAEISSEEESSDEDAKMDCESVISTFTNTDNHPGLIKTVKKIVKPKHKFELHKQFKVPLEGLMPIAEEITIKKEQREKKKSNRNAPYEVEEIESEDSSEKESANNNAEGDESNAKKEKKKLLK